MLQIIFDIVVIILLVLIVWLQISTKLFIESIHKDILAHIQIINNRVIQIIGSINILSKDINDLKSIVINRTKHNNLYEYMPIKDTVSKVTTIRKNVPVLKILKFELTTTEGTIKVTNKEHDMSFILSSDKRLHYQIRELVKCTCYEEDWFANPFKIVITNSKK